MPSATQEHSRAHQPRHTAGPQLAAMVRMCRLRKALPALA